MPTPLALSLLAKFQASGMQATDRANDDAVRVIFNPLEPRPGK